MRSVGSWHRVRGVAWASCSVLSPYCEGGGGGGRVPCSQMLKAKSRRTLIWPVTCFSAPAASLARQIITILTVLELHAQPWNAHNHVPHAGWCDRRLSKFLCKLCKQKIL